MKQPKKNIIDETLKMIKEQIGVELTPCDYFTGIHKSKSGKYFNALFPERLSESKEYDKLLTFANKYKLIRVESNGLKRVAIFFNNQ